MKIVVTADTYPPDTNGAATFAQQLAQGMAGRGHEVHVIAPSPRRTPYIEQVGALTEHRVRSHEYPMFPGFFVCLPWQTSPTVGRILAGLKPDLVHTQAHFVVGRYASKWANVLGIPLVATNHFMPDNLVDHLPLPIPRPILKYAARSAWRDLGHVFRRADQVTAPTGLAVDLLRRRAKLGGGRAVSCGIDSVPYAEAARSAAPNPVPTILFVGRLEQEKRVGVIIEALALLPRDLKCRLVVVGEGTQREPWARASEQLGVADRVEFTGLVPREELIAQFGACDIFCMPGVAELQSIVTLEAMSAAKPVLCANAVALPHLVEVGKNGYLFEPGNSAELAGYLEKLLRDEAGRRRMGEHSARMVRAHSLDNTLDTFEGIYRTAIDNMVRV